MESSIKARAGGIVHRCRRAIAVMLVSTVVLATTTSAYAAAFTEDFATTFDPGTSVQRTLGGQSFTFSVAGTQPDRDLRWDAGEMILFSGAAQDPAAEVVRIARSDTRDFQLTGLRLDVTPESQPATVQAYRDGAPVGPPVQVNPAGAQDIAFANLTVDEVLITSEDFWFTSIDDFTGDSGNPAPPTVTDGRISISGASGTGGAYKIGDTVTATWNNTAAGDNNSGITGVSVDFSDFGGGSAVAASNSSGTWTAIYTITSGAIDTTSRNVSVTATNAGGSTTTADTTNATVDSMAPTVTDGRISISGASGTGGAFKVGDTVSATWNNTIGGDNNSDSISSVTVNFTQFGGGAAVSASNSSGTWTATYTVVAGAIDATNRNITLTATDNAGNATSTSDTTNATVDNIRPSVGITVAGSPQSTDTAVSFDAAFSEPVVNVSTDDFTLAGAGNAAGNIVSVVGSGVAYTVNVAGITGNGTIKVDLNGSTNIVDDAGNPAVAYSGGAAHPVAVPTAPNAPTIGAATPGDGQVSVAFTAPAYNGGSAITGYTVTSNPGDITAGGNGYTTSPITVTGLVNGTPYTFTVTAINAIGTSVASGASGSATPMGAQTIVFAQPAAQYFGDSPALSATATSGLTVSFSSSTTGVCTTTSAGVLTFVTAGSCTINADQAGGGAWSAASTVSRTFTVNAIVPGAPTVGTATAGDTQANVSFTAPASSGGAAITGYTVTANPGGATGTGAGSPITVASLTNGIAYTFTVTATNSAGTGAASAATNSVTPAGAQTITFANPGAQSFGTSPNLSILGGGVTSTSGLPVSFTSSTTSVCTITSGGVLTFVTAGTCTINADQAGNSIYLPATQVSRSFTVIPVVPGAPTSTVATAGDTQTTITFVAPAYTGGSAITGYTVTVSPADVAPVNGGGSPIVVTGLTNGQAYTFSVTADNVAGTGPASIASNSVTPKATQTVTFINPGAQNFGTSPTLSATSDSGLLPTFTSSTTGVCTITSNGALTFVGVGMCTINADQAGNGSYLAATQVSRSFVVNGVVAGAPTAVAAAATGNDRAQVVFTAPAMTGGSAITAYTVTSAPGGATATGAASPITVTGLPAGVVYTFTVTATNAIGTSAPSTASNAVTIVPPLLARDVSVGLPYGAAATPIGLDIVGTPVSVAVVAAPTHGSVSVSGTTISYQPQAGYAGPDSFTYTATDAFSTSAPAAVTIQVAAATIALPAATLPNAVGGSAYRQAFSASGGTAPYSYVVSQGSLPAGITLSPQGELSGTPTQAGTFNFRVTATDSSTGTGPFAASQNHTLVVDAPTVSLTPATLPAAVNAQAYSQALSASGGTAPYTYAVVSGALPVGIDLSTSGALSGTASAAGAHAFTIEVRDAYGFTGTQAYNLSVGKAEQVIGRFVANPVAPTYAPNGTFALTASGGASPNPVTFASTTPAVCSVGGATVTMLSSGLCTLTADQAGDANFLPASQARLDVAIAAAAPQLSWMGDVQKVYGEPDFDLPDPRSDSRGAFTFSSRDPSVATVNGRTVTLVGQGTAVLVATQAAHGSYTAGEIEIQLLVADRPDPTLDPEVTGGLQAQVDASVRFASAQQSNIQGRLRQVRNGTNASSNALTLSYAGDGRQGLSLPIGQLGGNAWAGLPATSGWGVWAAGTMTLGKSDGGPSGFDFNTDGITVGADRAFGEHVLLGIAGSIGRNDSDFDRSPSRVDADQKSLALYGLWRAGDHLFVDGLLATGQLDFDIGRWSEATGSVASAQRDGDQVFGALTFGYEHQQPGMTLTGYGRVDGSRTTLDAYRESGLGVYDLTYGRQRVRNSALAVGMEGSHPLAGDAARYRPFWNIEYRQALDNNSSVDINYVTRPADRDYVLGVRSYNDDAFAVGAGLDVEFGSGWLFSLLLGHEQGRNAMTSNSIGLRLSYGSGGAPVAPTGDAAQLQSSEPECGRPRCRAR